MKITDVLRTTLLQKAIAARQHSYAPYSNFAVGAALLTKSGNIYTGCNVENAAFGAGICAERTAAVKAISEGDDKFVAIAVAGYPINATREQLSLAFPCGICRQFLNEFALPNMPVFVVKTVNDYVETSLEEILPHAFGPKNLKNTLEE